MRKDGVTGHRPANALRREDDASMECACMALLGALRFDLWEHTGVQMPPQSWAHPPTPS